MNHLGLHVLLFAVIGLLGCGSRSSSEAEAEAVLEEKPWPITVSVNSASQNLLPPDGQSVGHRDESDRVASLIDQVNALKLKASGSDKSEAVDLCRSRNREVIRLATAVLRLTLDQPHRATEFHEALKSLLEARVELALSGDQGDVDQLYADVAALNGQNPNSDATAEGIYHLALFAHAKSRQATSDVPVWLADFSRWACEFAQRFPLQKQRAAELVSAAANSCELHVQVESDQRVSIPLLSEATACYSLLLQNYADTKQGQEAAAVLRRFHLPGQRLTQFGGPTLDGGYISAGDFVGAVTCIYFYDSKSQTFRNQTLPALLKVSSDALDQIRFVGVSLDEDESAARRFVRDKGLPGQQIFFSEKSLRSWNNPLVRFWGISRIPCLWVVDTTGVVSAVDLSESRLAKALSAVRR